MSNFEVFVGDILTKSLAVVNTVTNRVVRLLGKDETVRWMQMTLYQGAPAKKGLTTVVSQLYVSSCFKYYIQPSSGGSSFSQPSTSRKGSM